MTRTLMLAAGADMTTARLIRCARALKLSGHVPPETGRQLVNLATSVRLFVECNEHRAASALLIEMLGAFAEGDPELKPAAEVLGRAVKGVERQIAFDARFERGDSTTGPVAVAS
jgi:hypothetical protein